VEFDSQWLYRRGDNPDWKFSDSDEGFWTKRKLPDFGIERKEKISGYFWYRCKFYLPETKDLSFNPIAVSIGKFKDMDEFYFNGVLIGQTGQMGPKLEVDYLKERVYTIPDNLFKPGENVIAIRGYSYTSLRGFKVPVVMDKEIHIRESLFKAEVFTIMCGYTILLMGLYFLVGAFYRGRAKENLYFSLFSLGLGFYTLLRTQHRYFIFTSFSASFNIELLVLFPLPVVFLNFLYNYLDQKKSRLQYLFELVIAGIIITVLIYRDIRAWGSTVGIFNYCLPFAVLIGTFYTVRNFRQNLSKKRYLYLGFLVLVPCVFIDSLSALEIWYTPPTLYLGFLVFLLMISLELSEEMEQGIKNYFEQEKMLTKMERSKTDFLFKVSGEFRFWLDQIQDKLNKIRKLKTPKAMEGSIQELDAYCDSATRMLEEASLLRSLEDKDYQKIEGLVEVGPILKETVESVEQSLGVKRKNIKITTEPESLKVVTDRYLLKTILRNLIENAYLYTPQDSEIFIEAKVDHSWFQITVKDKGPGIRVEEGENVFTKFLRGWSMNGEEGAVPRAGIGLGLVKLCTEELDGTVDLISKEGKGSEFIVVLSLFSR
jgi:signal transduction histidine kinase